MSARVSRAWVLGVGIVVALLGYGLGSHGLWDPWETHYAEVARQVLVRADPINLWWQPGEGPDGLDERRFLSKPPLAFWLMAASLRAFGLGTSPEAAELLLSGWTEVAVRLPSLVLAVVTCVVLGRTVRRFAGNRAGLLTMFACATLPQLGLLARQALTDMTLVATLSCGLCAAAVANLDADMGATVPRRDVGPVSIPWSPWAAIAVSVVALLGAAPVLAIHVLSREWIQMLPYEIGLVIVLCGLVRARTDRELAWVVAHACAGASFVAKGLVGPGLYLAVLVAFALVQGRGRRSIGAMIRPVPVLAFMCAALPWYHAMVVREGLEFVRVLVVEHQLQRFAIGEQPQAAGGIGFYAHALLLGTFPWVAALPAAVVHLWPRRSRPTAADGFCTLMLCWLVVAVLVVSVSATKYHHYLAPALPPVAALVALTLSSEAVGVGVLVGVGLPIWALAVAGLSSDPAALIRLVTYAEHGPWQQVPVDPWLVPAVSLPVAIGLVIALRARTGWMVPTAFTLGATLVAAATLHPHMRQAATVWSQRPLHERALALDPARPVVAWRLNHRGETLYSKARVWVSLHGDAQALRDRLAVLGARPQLVITAPQHVAELRTIDPSWTVEVVTETPQRALVRLTP